MHIDVFDTLNITFNKRLLYVRLIDRARFLFALPLKAFLQSALLYQPCCGSGIVHQHAGSKM